MNNWHLIYLELGYFAHSLPKRAARLLFHFSYFLGEYKLLAKPENLLIWMLDLIMMIGELFGVFELLQISHLIFKPGIRKMNIEEQNVIRAHFPGKVNLNLITIDSNAKIGTKSLATAYVWRNTINYDGQLSLAIFLHEVVHVWQYQNFGIIYLVRALIAQRKKNPYDFGGWEGLYSAMLNGKNFMDWNFEQQGSIIEFLHQCKSSRKLNPMEEAISIYIQNSILALSSA